METACFLYNRIHRACAASGRSPDSVTLVGVSKKQPVDRIQTFIDFENASGRVATLGENYVQEWEAKQSKLRGDFVAHCIGHLQSNKAPLAAQIFSIIETVDSVKLAKKLDRGAAQAGRVLPVYIQVNVSRDPAKSGLLLESLPSLVQSVCEMQHLTLEGLMTITAVHSNQESTAREFRELRILRDELAERLDKPLQLSMGMSDDFECAIQEGATHVRIGTALFGERTK